MGAGLRDAANLAWKLTGVLIAPRLALVPGLSGHVLDSETPRLRGEPRLALATTAGALLAVLHVSLVNPEGVTDATCDEVAEQLLRMLGVALDEAREFATAPLPDVSAVSQV